MIKKKIAVLSNVTMDLIVARLRKTFDVYTPDGYDAWISDILNEHSNLYTFNAEAIVILLDGTESRTWADYKLALNRIDLWKKALEFLITKLDNIPVFVSTIDIRANAILAMSEASFATDIEYQWFTFVSEKIRQHRNLFWYDLKSSIMNLGRNTFYSDKMWYMGNMPFSREGLAQIVRDLQTLVDGYYSPSKKVIVLDLDNTLWGGVIGEDGVEGIELSDHKEGQRFYDFQRQLLEMKKRGVLLAINSKNNLEDAKKIFDEHPFSVLKWDDFVCKKVNWNQKAANIKEMEKELNLTEGAFIFIDDNPIEREIVKGECPEVEVLEFPEDTTSLFRFAEEFYAKYFRQARVLLEDSKKTEMYLAEEKRRAHRDSSIDLNEYIEKLEMEADIHLMRKSEIERVAQLCNKTNQFNVTTKRYSEKDIIQLSQDRNVQIFTVYAKDKYGEAGLVSVLIGKVYKENVLIDTFLMSCRVMGRKLENVIFGEICRYYKNRSISQIHAEYIQTKKNAPVMSLYENLGFALVEKFDDRKTYIYDLKDWRSAGDKVYKNITFSAQVEDLNESGSYWVCR